MRHVIPLALLALAGGAACKGGDRAPDCKAVGAAYATLQQHEIEKAAATAGAPPGAREQKQEALSLIPLVKEAMVKECEEKKWDGETRRCVVGAKTPDDLERCRTRKDEPAAESAPGDAPGETAPAGAAGEGAAGEGAGEAGKAPETAPAPEKTDSP
jgi:hypothetical protein